jgi:hypothetical protein
MVKHRLGKICLCAVTLFVALLILVILVSSQPPKITVELLAITNVASGNQEAWFELSNTGNIPIEVWLPGEIEVKNQQLVLDGTQMSSNVTMQPGANLRTCLIPPVTHDRWRAAFFCPLPLSPVRKFAIRYGFPIFQGGASATSVSCGWLDPTLEANESNQTQSPNASTNHRF